MIKFRTFRALPARDQRLYDAEDWLKKEDFSTPFSLEMFSRQPHQLDLGQVIDLLWRSGKLSIEEVMEWKKKYPSFTLSPALYGEIRRTLLKRAIAEIEKEWKEDRDD